MKESTKVNEPNPLTKQEVINLLNHIGDQEKHFNGLETQYRLLSSTWLLACLGAVGYLIQSDKAVLLDKWMLVGAVGVIGDAGIFLLWIIDIRVYHKLLNSVFIQGVLLESQYDFLPKIRTNMLMSFETGDVIKSTGFYYIGSCMLLLLGSLVVFFIHIDDPVFKAFSFLAGLIIAAVQAIFMYKSAQSKQAKNLYYSLKNSQNNSN